MKPASSAARIRRQRGMALMIALFALVVISIMAAAMMTVSTEASRMGGNTHAIAAEDNAAAAAAEAARSLLGAPNSVLRSALGSSPGNVVYIVNYQVNGVAGQPWVYSGSDHNYDWSYAYTPDPFSSSQAGCEAALAAAIAAGQGPPASAPAGCVATGFTAAQSVATAAAGGTLALHLPPQVAWVRINLATEDTAGQVIDASNSALAAAALEYDTSAGRYPQGSSLGATATDPQPVYQIVAYASQRLVREEAAPEVFPFQAPAAIFETGTDPTFSHPDSANWGANGQDSASATELPALGGTSATAVSNLISQLKRPDNYTGAGGSPSVINLVTPPGGISALNSNYDEVGSVAPQTGLEGLLAQIAKVAQNRCVAPGGILSCNGAVPTFTTPQVTIVEGDITLPTSGTGIIVATGTITLPNNIDWNGLIMDIGTGVISGTNGHPTFNGAIFDANICGNNSGISEAAVPTKFSAKFPELAACNQIGNSTLEIGNGGGNGGMQYDSQTISQSFNSASLELLDYRETNGMPQ